VVEPGGEEAGHLRAPASIVRVDRALDRFVNVLFKVKTPRQGGKVTRRRTLVFGLIVRTKKNRLLFEVDVSDFSLDECVKNLGCDFEAHGRTTSVAQAGSSWEVLELDVYASRRRGAGLTVTALPRRARAMSLAYPRAARHHPHSQRCPVAR
jgi:hypothetical protein